MTAGAAAYGEVGFFEYPFDAADVAAQVIGRVSAEGATSIPDWSKATTGTQWTKTWYDGFGRVSKVESGYSSTTVSVAETLHAPCACSPLGKVWKRKPSGVEHYYFYDAAGQRILTDEYANDTTLTFSRPRSMYFGGKLLYQNGWVISTDRLGSVPSLLMSRSLVSNSFRSQYLSA